VSELISTTEARAEGEAVTAARDRLVFKPPLVPVV
jgi:hypothetical protein